MRNALLVLVACGSPGADTNDVQGADDTGTPTLPDLDADDDGFTDDEELGCGSDPGDVTSTCYACGWSRGDLSPATSIGNEIGDTIANLDLVDQCGEHVPLWDMAGMYHILFLTAAW
jgi:hypothetical protein